MDWRGRRDLRELQIWIRKRERCTYIGTLPVFLNTIQDRLGHVHGTLCNIHFHELTSGCSLSSQCARHRLCCGLAGVAEGTGNGSDGRKTSFMLAEAAPVPVSLALSSQPSTGHVSLHIYFDGRGAVLPAPIEAHSEDMTPWKHPAEPGGLAARLTGC